MTKKEAINILKRNYPNRCFKSLREAVDMAIEALKEPEQITGKWIPVKTRPMDEDERKEWWDKLKRELEDYEAVIYTSPLPDDGQDVLVYLRNGDIIIDCFYRGNYGYFFVDSHIEEVVAWMLLPKPWEGK